MSAPDKPALSTLVSPRSLGEFYAGFTPGDGDDAGYFVSEGDPGRLPASLRATELRALTRVRFRSTSLLG
jgi:hypothetical protein